MTSQRPSIAMAAFSGTIRPPQTLVGKAAGPKSAKSSILQMLFSTTGVR